MSAPARFEARLLGMAWLSGDTFHLDLEKPADFHFVAGQGVRLSGNGVEREYSLVCSPAESRLSVCVQVVAKGAFSPFLARLETGSVLTVSGPHGYFIFQPSHRPAVFVATGTGIAPFVSMARSGISDFTLFHGASSAAELHYRDQLQPLAGRYVACITRQVADDALPSWARGGRVSNALKSDLPPGAFDFYLCGNREMIRDVAAIVDERFPGSRLFFEVFY